MSNCPPYDPVVAVRHLGEADPVMAELTAEIGECGLDYRTGLDPFQELLRSIVYQQLSGHAAASILNRVLELFDSNFPTPTALLETADDQLRSCGLSWSKIRAVKDLAEKTSGNLLPAPKDIVGMSSEEIIKAFSTVRGIGPWTVEMLLISMGRPDILPVTDLGVRRGFSVAYETGELPTPKELLERGECWRPFRSVASWYLWQAASPKFRAESG